MIDIIESTAQVFHEKYGIEKEVTKLMFEEGAIKQHAIKDFLVKEEYTSRVSSKKRTEVQNDIAERFCVSVKYVEKVIYKK